MDFHNIWLLKDNSFNELNNVQSCQRTTAMDSNNMQLLKDNSFDELNNNDNAKGQLQ